VTLTPLLTDPAGSTAPLAPAEATAPGWAVPWALLLLVAVLVGPAVMAARLRRRRLEGAIDAEQPATSPIEPDRELVDQSP
jgi:hypothetical protein